MIKLKLTQKEKSISAGFAHAIDKTSFDQMAFLACKCLSSLSEIDVSDRGELSRFAADTLLTNPKTIIFDLSQAMFSGEDAKSRLLAHEIGSRIAGGITDVYSKDE